MMDGGNLCNDKPSRTLLTTCHSCFACLYFIQIPNSITTIFDIQDLSLFRLKKKTPVFCAVVLSSVAKGRNWAGLRLPTNAVSEFDLGQLAPLRNKSKVKSDDHHI